jgi:putative oxidoreductase
VDVATLNDLDDVARLLARLTVSVLMLFHGANYLRGDRQIFEIVKARGLPEATGYLAVIGLVVAPVCAILGVYTRIAGAAMALFLLAGVLLFHMGHLFMLAPKRDAYYLETQVFFFMGGVIVALLGAGRFGLGIGGVWN